MSGYDENDPNAMEPESNEIVLKIGMIGDSQIGKTSLMVKYVEGCFDDDYIQTLGVNFMEKTVAIRGHDIKFSVWDLGGQREFTNMLPLVARDAVAIFYMFDLSRKTTLNSIKEWYPQGRGMNKGAIPFLVGTKYDVFSEFSSSEKEIITRQARQYAKAMHAPLVFCSSSHSINVQKLFKIVLSKAFDLKCSFPALYHFCYPDFQPPSFPVLTCLNHMIDIVDPALHADLVIHKNVNWLEWSTVEETAPGMSQPNESLASKINQDFVSSGAYARISSRMRSELQINGWQSDLKELAMKQLRERPGEVDLQELAETMLNSESSRPDTAQAVLTAGAIPEDVEQKIVGMIQEYLRTVITKNDIVN